MTLLELKQEDPGTYMCVVPVGGTIGLLADWLASLEIQNPLLPSDLHVTVLYSRKTISPALSTREYRAEPIGFKVFTKDGVNTLVLLLDTPEITQRHRHLISLGATHDFPDFTPHLTVSYDAGDVDMSKLELPKFGLLFGHERISKLED